MNVFRAISLLRGVAAKTEAGAPVVIRDAARYGLILTIALIAEALLISWLRLPSSFGFMQFAFLDPGSDLVIDYLCEQGDRPGVDNGYQYGLLSLVAGRVIFAILGRNPFAWQVSAVLASVVLAWGLARFAIYSRNIVAGGSLSVLTLSHLIPSIYPCFSQMLEMGVLCHALVEHLRSRRTTALAMAAACIFIKPTMAYFYGLLLTLLILRDWWVSRTGGILGLVASFLPAAAVVVVLSVGLSIAYGFDSLITCVLPIAGARVYRAHNFGFFFGIGRDFWRPSGARLGYYIGTFAGFYITSTLLLFAGVVAISARLIASGYPRRTVSRNFEVACVCIVLHFAYICFFFGNAWSWYYYAYFTILGLVAITPLFNAVLSIVILTGLFILAALSHLTMIRSTTEVWQTYRRFPETAGLYASPDDREDWSRAIKATRGKKAVILALSEGLPLITPGFEPPVLRYIAHKGLRGVEVERKRIQIANAEVVVETNYTYSGKWTSEAFVSDLGETLRGFKEVYVGRRYRVLRRCHPDDHQEVDGM